MAKPHSIWLTGEYIAKLDTIKEKKPYTSQTEAARAAIDLLYDGLAFTPATVCDACGLVSKTDISHFKDGKNRCSVCAAAYRQELKEGTLP